MQYLIGAVVGGVILFLFTAKRRVDRLNRMCLLNFASWHTAYLASVMPEKKGMARAFLLQTLHLAERMGVFGAAEIKNIERGLRLENPVQVVDEWLGTALLDVVAVCGRNELERVNAQLAGTMMLVCLKGINPQGDLKRFLQSR
jgi:hypothetical protein